MTIPLSRLIIHLTRPPLRDTIHMNSINMLPQEQITAGIRENTAVNLPGRTTITMAIAGPIGRTDPIISNSHNLRQVARNQLHQSHTAHCHQAAISFLRLDTVQTHPIGHQEGRTTTIPRREDTILRIVTTILVDGEDMVRIMNTFLTTVTMIRLATAAIALRSLFWVGKGRIRLRHCRHTESSL